MEVKLEGMDELIKKLKKNVKLDDVRKIVKYRGSELQRSAMRLAPVDTGTLYRGIGLDIKDSGMTAEVEPTADYAPYVEYGTRKMSAQPFMRPAFRAQKSLFLSDLEKLMR